MGINVTDCSERIAQHGDGERRVERAGGSRIGNLIEDDDDVPLPLQKGYDGRRFCLNVRAPHHRTSHDGYGAHAQRFIESWRRPLMEQAFYFSEFRLFDYSSPEEEADSRSFSMRIAELAEESSGDCSLETDNDVRDIFDDFEDEHAADLGRILFWHFFLRPAFVKEQYVKLSIILLSCQGFGTAPRVLFREVYKYLQFLVE